MSNHNHQQVDFELLGKYLSGEATPEEGVALDNWILDAPENRKLFDQVSVIWNQAKQQQGHQLPDKEKLLHEIKAHLATAKVYPVRKRLYLSSIAAVFLLLAAAAIYIFFFREREQVIRYVNRATGTGIYRDTLSDHSLVVLNSNSNIKYPENFKRTLHLTGEAWFDVTSDQENPFIVSVGDIYIKVLGTSFNVHQQQKTIEVAVKTGAVMMYRDNQQIIVKADELGMYNVENHLFKLDSSFNVNSIGYVTRIFNFENASLKEIVAQLEKAYDITVVFENKKLENCTMSSPFENKSIKYIFEVISITLNVECRIENNTVYISGEGCN
ncbi:FecR family protein [Chitinophaga sp. CF118]|uniref:FecR family protein n=1 Tax=Chitinophaga sp. CF118 TaxID=1884367 RepID=UPI0008EB2A32|nr:FecR family protein [Chitinophaga sp. CF118]SFD75513.1 FecR family protein [Chitinophaga sp. CF118]